MERFDAPAPSPETTTASVDAIETSRKWLADADREIAKLQGYIDRFKQRVQENSSAESFQALYHEAMEGQLASMETALALMTESRNVMSHVPEILTKIEDEHEGNYPIAA